MIKIHAPAAFRPPGFPIHAALPMTVADCTRGVAGFRSSSCRLRFEKHVRADGGETNGRRCGILKRVDMATLGNLCVDIVLNVPSLPPASREERREYMERLAAIPPDKKYWEAGGNCNLAFAAARLGLHVITLGFVGDEIYGHFLLDVLQEEGVDAVSLSENSEAAKADIMYETLLCWVLVDPIQRHGFCSRADFSDEPAFSWLHKLSGQVEIAIQQSKILFCNGYAFDELLPDIIVSALFCAVAARSAVFFDPGPRGKAIFNGAPEKRRALEQFLKLSDVLLFTSDEAESLTGIKNPILAGRALLDGGVRVEWVIIKMGAKGSVLITRSSIFCAPAFTVKVVDTVGCGDSYTAAIAYGFLHDMPPMNTLALANAVGAATATGCGAGRNVAAAAKVFELLSRSSMNEDDEFWSNLADAVPAAEEICLLSTTNVGGCCGRLVRVPIRTVVARIEREFEIARLGGCGRREEQVIDPTRVDCR